MIKYTIVIEETIVQEFQIDAENEEDAIRIAEQKYKNGDIVLCPGEVQFRRMAINNPHNTATKWVN